VVLRGPLRELAAHRSRKSILIYILIEHQSEPDPLMPLRILDYEVQIYNAQLREWARHHASFAGFRFQPVLPVVFYTGTRTWDSIGQLVDQMELGDRLVKETPHLEPQFINLGTTPPDQLETEGGFFGWVHRLVQERQARPAEFRALLERVVRHLETMSDSERLRWLDFLSYIHAFVYHDRGAAEEPDLQEKIEASVQSDEHRQEVRDMGKSFAHELMDKGRKEGRREGRKEALLRFLRNRFGDLPSETIDAINATVSVRQLDAWLDRVSTAQTLAEMRIGLLSKPERKE
jgi:hypothetical protein